MAKEVDHSIYYEDFSEGDAFLTPARTITEADVYAFAGLTGDFNPIHVNKDYSEKGDFGQRIVHGLYGMALAEGLKTMTGIYRTTCIASLGYNDWRFLKPIFFGDTVHVEFVIEEKKDTSNPETGILFIRVKLINQNDVVVQDGIHVLLMKCRSPRKN